MEKGTNKPRALESYRFSKYKKTLVFLTMVAPAAINEASKLPTRSLRMVLVARIVVPIACAADR